MSLDIEGRSWWLDQIRQRRTHETAPSATPIADAAFDMIVNASLRHLELTPEQTLTPVWLGGDTGAIAGLGYDLGFATSNQISSDWRHRLSEMWCHRLEGLVGKRGGGVGKDLANTLSRAAISIKLDDARWVLRHKVLPRYVGRVEANLGNSWLLGPTCLGALVSLAYRRGADFNRVGERYTEMREIAEAMHAAHFEHIPPLFRAMARLWPDDAELIERCETEAALFERGLAEILRTTKAGEFA